MVATTWMFLGKIFLTNARKSIKDTTGEKEEKRGP
jgi:hypothetical protein